MKIIPFDRVPGYNLQVPIIQVQSVPAPPVFPTANFMEGLVRDVRQGGLDADLKRARIDNQHQAILDRALARKAAFLKASGVVTPLDTLKAQTAVQRAWIQHLRGQTDANANYHDTVPDSVSTSTPFSFGDSASSLGGNKITLLDNRSATDDLGGLWAGGSE